MTASEPDTEPVAASTAAPGRRAEPCPATAGTPAKTPGGGEVLPPDAPTTEHCDRLARLL